MEGGCFSNFLPPLSGCAQGGEGGCPSLVLVACKITASLLSPPLSALCFSPLDSAPSFEEGYYAEATGRSSGRLFSVACGAPGVANTKHVGTNSPHLQPPSFLSASPPLLPSQTKTQRRLIHNIHRRRTDGGGEERETPLRCAASPRKKNNNIFFCKKNNFCKILNAKI